MLISKFDTTNIAEKIAMIHSIIDFDIGRENLFDYEYLDGEFVKIDVQRII